MYATLGYFAYFQAGVGALMPFLRADLDLSFTAGSLHFVAFSTRSQHGPQHRSTHGSRPSRAFASSSPRTEKSSPSR
jgi:hypothetical protein